MIKLTIKKEDGSVYWVEHFNSLDACNEWLEVEQTRPYWNSQYTTETLEIPSTPSEPDYKELRAREYPPMAEYLDGIVKNDQEQINKYITDCLAVKAKYPKP